MNTQETILTFGFLILFLWYQLRRIRESLESISTAVQDLTKDNKRLSAMLCGDPRMEESIERANEVGATLTDEQLNYQRGILSTISDQLSRMASGLRRTTE
jgi:hypothetical protein